MADNANRMATDILAAYVSNNKVPTDRLQELIEATIKTVSKVYIAEQPPRPAPRPASQDSALKRRPKPAVAISESVTPDYIICLDDGLRFKRLSQHLTKLGMTAAEYREKWGLPLDYPLVADNYRAAVTSTRNRLYAERAKAKQAKPQNRPAPVEPPRQSQTAIADAIRAAAEAQPDAASALPLSTNAAAYIGVPTPVEATPAPLPLDAEQPAINPAWFNMQRTRQRHDKRMVEVEVRRRPKFTSHAPVVNGAGKA